MIDANAVILLNVLKLNYTPPRSDKQQTDSGQKKVISYEMCLSVANSGNVYLRDGPSQTHWNQRPQLHHFQEEEAEAETEGEGVEEVSDGTDDLGGGEEPGNHAGEGDDDSNQEEDAHALVSIQGPVTHLDEDVGQHPQRDADTEYCQGNHHQGPGPPNEGLVGGDDRHVPVSSSGGGGAGCVDQVLAGVQRLDGAGVDRSVFVLGIDQRGG